MRFSAREFFLRASCQLLLPAGRRCTKSGPRAAQAPLKVAPAPQTRGIFVDSGRGASRALGETIYTELRPCAALARRLRAPAGRRRAKSGPRAV